MKSNLIPRLHRLIPAALLGAALLSPLAGRAEPANLFSTDFSKGADGWTLVSGSFKAANGAYRGLAMEESNRLARTVTGDPAWKDYGVTARLKLDRTANDRADYGVIARYQDKNNYYMVLYKTHSKHCTIEAKINGKLKTLAEAPCDIDPAQWHEFQFTVTGPALALVVDGKPLLKAEHTAIASGAAGLLAFYDEIQSDRFVVEAIAAP